MKKTSKTSKSNLLQQADSKLSDHGEENASTMAEADTQRLVHELKVRQIELEMQNEELIRTRTEVEEMYRQYADLYDFAPVGYFTLGRDGTILETNLAGTKLLSVEREKLINRRLGLFVSEELRSVFSAFLENLASCEGTETCELAFKKGENELLWARFEASCFEDGQKCRAALMDITERKQAEEALKESEYRHKIVSELTSDYVFVVDVDPGGKLKLRWVSDNMLRMTGRTIKDAETPDLWKNIIHPDDNVRFFDFVNQILSSGMAGELDCKSIHNNGGERWICISAQPKIGEGNKVTTIVGAIKDITARKQAEEALKDSEFFIKGVLNSLTAHIAVLDNQGQIIAVNESWRNFARENESPNSTDYMGANYLSACQAAIQLGEPIAKRVYQGIRSVTDGSQSEFNIEYPCHSPTQQRWFTVTVLPMHKSSQGLVVIHQDITERKLAEEALKQSEAHYHLLADNMTDVIWLRDLNLNLLYVSPSEEKIRGYTLAELQQIPFDQLLTPDSVQVALELFNTEVPKILADPTYSPVITREFEFYRRNGLLHTVESNMSIVRDGNGIPTAIMGQDRDITERKRMEQALKQSETQYRLLVENQTDLVVKVDNQGRFLYVSPSYCKAFGKTEAELLGKSFLPLVHQDDVEATQNEMKKLYQSPYTCHIEQRAMTKDGWRWFGWSDTAELNENNEVVSIIGVGRDITKRKMAEEALRESEERFHKAFHSGPVGIAITRASDGVYIDVNEAFSKIVGFCREELAGQSSLGLNIITLEQRRYYMEKIRDEGFIHNDEMVLRHKSGESRVVLGSMEVVDLNHTACVLSTAIDVTERKRAELELQYMKASLESANTDLQAALAREQQLSHTDVLTGINNRRKLYELAEYEFEIAMRYQQPLSVMMFDLDHFKQVNDTFGHAAGDQILQLVTQAASAELRSADVIGRYGGEEFVVILPMTNAQQAYPLAERIRERVAKLSVPTEKGDAAVTLSIGIVEILHNTRTASTDDLIRRADETMYAAKQAGRNRTEIESL